MNNFSMRGLRWKMPETEGVQIFAGEVDINGIKIVHVKYAFDKDGNALGSSINLPIPTES
jgi:hypothetical protein